MSHRASGAGSSDDGGVAPWVPPPRHVHTAKRETRARRNGPGRRVSPPAFTPPPASQQVVARRLGRGSPARRARPTQGRGARSRPPPLRASRGGRGERPCRPPTESGGERGRGPLCVHRAAPMGRPTPPEMPSPHNGPWFAGGFFQCPPLSGFAHRALSRARHRDSSRLARGGGSPGTPPRGGHPLWHGRRLGGSTAQIQYHGPESPTMHLVEAPCGPIGVRAQCDVYMSRRTRLTGDPTVELDYQARSRFKWNRWRPGSLAGGDLTFGHPPGCTCHHESTPPATQTTNRNHGFRSGKVPTTCVSKQSCPLRRAGWGEMCFQLRRRRPANGARRTKGHSRLRWCRAPAAWGDTRDRHSASRGHRRGGLEGFAAAEPASGAGRARGMGTWRAAARRPGRLSSWGSPAAQLRGN